MFGAMLKSFKRVKHEPARPTISDYERNLLEIWESLDSELKAFAKSDRPHIAPRGNKIRFNEKGMAELVRQLDEIGYEIRKKKGNRSQRRN